MSFTITAPTTGKVGIQSATAAGNLMDLNTKEIHSDSLGKGSPNNLSAHSGGRFSFPHLNE